MEPNSFYIKLLYEHKFLKTLSARLKEATEKSKTTIKTKLNTPFSKPTTKLSFYGGERKPN